MIRAQRRRHLLTWALLGPAILIGLAMAAIETVRARPEPDRAPSQHSTISPPPTHTPAPRSPETSPEASP